MRVAWLAEAKSWGPLTRAVAVLGGGSPVDGVVIGQRSVFDNEPLDAERVPWVQAFCCEQGPGMQWHLDHLDVDVIVSDMCHAPLAEADGRPFITLGMHGAGHWDLDAMPLHPWEWQALPRRVDVRALWGMSPSTPVVVAMSNHIAPDNIEHRIRDSVPDGALLVSLHEWGSARRMVGADLVVCTAGWSSSWEARWSGVPACVLDIGGPDQAPRATHTLEEAREAVRNVQCVDLPADHTAERPDHLRDFHSVLTMLADAR